MEGRIKFESANDERLIVGYLFRDRSTFLKLSKYLTTHGDWQKDSYFTDSKLQFIVNCCWAYEHKYHQMISEEILCSNIEKIIKDPFLQEQMKKTVNDLKKIDYSEISGDYIRDVAVDFIKKARAVEATYENQMDIAEGNYDNLSKRMQDAVNVNLDKDLGLSLKDSDSVLSILNEEVDDSVGCSWGSFGLDEKLGKIMPGEIGVVCGVPGAGKTAWLGHFGVSNFLNKKNVALFSFEVDKRRLSSRFYKTLFGVDTMGLLKMAGDPKGAERARRMFESPEVGDIRIIDKPANTFSSNDMSAVLNDLKTYENWKPDMILVDYILITSTNDKKMDSSNTYKYYKTVTEELRNLAKEWQCPLITACQINREGMGDKGGSKAALSSKNISESRGVLDTADYVLMIEQTDKEKVTKTDANGAAESGEYRIKIDKNRNGDSGMHLGFEINWKTLRITDKIKS